MVRHRDSSIRVSTGTRKRVSDLVRRLEASSQQEIVDRALDKLEESLFWDGFDDEAREYLKRYPQERVEREIFGHTSADHLQAKRARR